MISIRTLFFTCCLGVIVLPSAPKDIRAVETPQAPSFDSPAKLQKQIEGLLPFEGKWACEGILPKSGKHIASQIILAPDLEGAWLTLRHDDASPDRFHALEL